MKKYQFDSSSAADIGDYLKVFACTAMISQPIMSMIMGAGQPTHVQDIFGVFYNLVKYTAPAFIFGILYTTIRTNDEKGNFSYAKEKKPEVSEKPKKPTVSDKHSTPKKEHKVKKTKKAKKNKKVKVAKKHTTSSSRLAKAESKKSAKSSTWSNNRGPKSEWTSNHGPQVNGIIIMALKVNG